MLTVNKVLPGGRGLAPALVRRAPQVELGWDVRQKSRFDCTDSTGRRLGVFLPRGSAVRGGDVLVAEDGSLRRVVAAPQPVLTVRAAEDRDGFGLLRAAYHLGNRHVPLELQPDRLRLEPDHVLAELLRAMGLAVLEELAPFEPEGGAYAAAGGAAAHRGDRHSHDHGHDQSHGDGHGHDHGHHPGHGHDHGAVAQPQEPGPRPARAQAQVHGPDGDHDHGDGQRAAQGSEAGAQGDADAARPRGRAVGVPVAPAAAPHVHGPGCKHGPHDH